MFARRVVTPERRCSALLRNTAVAGKCGGCSVDRDYQFKGLFFPHTYGFILSEDIDMQIRSSRAADTRCVTRGMYVYPPREYDNVMCIASYGIVRFHLLVAQCRADLASRMHDRLRMLFRD